MQFDDFLGVLALLKDTSSYEAKLQALVDREHAITFAIESLNLGNDIQAALDLADKRVEDSKNIIADAKIQADKIVADSRTVYDGKFAQLQAQQIVAEQAIADLKGYKSTYAVKDDTLNRAIKDNADLQQSLVTEKASVIVLQTELDARLVKLREVMG